MRASAAAGSSGANGDGLNPQSSRVRPSEGQSVRSVRHHDKLEEIRASLNPYYQTQDAPPQVQSPLPAALQKDLVDQLVRLGHQKENAQRALENLGFTTVLGANQYLCRELTPGHAFNRNGASCLYVNGAPNVPSTSGIPSISSRHPPHSSHINSNYPDDCIDSPGSVSPSTQYRSPSPIRSTMNIDYQSPATHRSHLNIFLNPPHPSDTRAAPHTPPSTNRPTIKIEPGCKSDLQSRSGQSRSFIPASVIHAVFTDPPPPTANLHIKIEPRGLPQAGSVFNINYKQGNGAINTVTGVPKSITGMQHMTVNTDLTDLQSMPYQEQRREQPRQRGISPKPGTSRMHNEPSSNSVTRSVSPLPPSVEQKLRQNTFESVVKPIKPKLYMFYMVQHVERVIQAYHERAKRVQQLEKEMQSAGLGDAAKDELKDFLIKKESKYIRLRRQKMNKNMFTMLKHIGVGAFGRVTLVKKKDTGQVYAMKTLLKDDVIKKQQASHVKAERDILAEANSPWIVKLFFSFQDERCLYFVMEYVPGGDMMQLLINKGIFNESLAKFYIAELTCAIEYVHSLNFIHRDIKPDNILIDRDGHIKLTDFGLCTGLRWTHDRKYYGPDNDDSPAHARNDSFTLPEDAKMKVLDLTNNKTRNQALSVVGTGNYMAPEVLRRSGHTQLCDWWSVGVILYEMVIGRPPFMSSTEDSYEIQYKIIHWRQHLTLPLPFTQKLSPECINLIEQLICETTDRIGRLNGAKDVMLHPWFYGIDFANLRKQPAEYIPRVDHAEDTQNFDTVEVAENPLETMRKGKAPANNPAFFEFTFRHFFNYDGKGCPSLRPQKRPSIPSQLVNGNGAHLPTTSTAPMTTYGSKMSNPGMSSPSTSHHNRLKNPMSSRPPPPPSQSFRNIGGGLHHTPLPENDDDDGSDESFIV